MNGCYWVFLFFLFFYPVGAGGMPLWVPAEHQPHRGPWVLTNLCPGPVRGETGRSQQPWALLSEGFLPCASTPRWS